MKGKMKMRVILDDDLMIEDVEYLVIVSKHDFTLYHGKKLPPMKMEVLPDDTFKMANGRIIKSIRIMK
jgi:hypothetical protein